MDRAPRVLHLIPSMAASSGGIAKVDHSALKLFSKKQKEGRLEVFALSLTQPENSDEDNLLQSLVGDKRSHHNGNYFPFAVEAIRRATQWADLIYSSHIGLSQIRLLVPKPSLKMVTFIHGTEVWLQLPLRKQLALRMSNRILSNTLFTSNRCKEINPSFSGALPCHLGVATKTISKSNKLTANRQDIVAVGRMNTGEDDGKGHPILFKAMEAVIREVPSARLFVVGAGSLLTSYRELVSHSSAVDHIHFLGKLPEEELLSLYDQAGIFCLPSQQEGFGLVFIEAMRAGLPVIASAGTSAEEIIENEKTGLLVEPGIPNYLSAALIRILKDDGLREKLGKNGKDRFQEHFTEDHFHQRLWALLEPLL